MFLRSLQALIVLLFPVRHSGIVYRIDKLSKTLCVVECFQGMTRNIFIQERIIRIVETVNCIQAGWFDYAGAFVMVNCHKIYVTLHYSVRKDLSSGQIMVKFSVSVSCLILVNAIDRCIIFCSSATRL